MSTLVSHLDTDTPERYARQLCRHAQQLAARHDGTASVHAAGALAELDIHAESRGSHATISLDPWGRCRLRARPSQLVICVDADDEAALQRVADIVSRNLARFSAGALQPVWARVEGPAIGGQERW
jgi:hypothetical protein